MAGSASETAADRWASRMSSESTTERRNALRSPDRGTRPMVNQFPKGSKVRCEREVRVR
jgi:hypothetical protein